MSEYSEEDQGILRQALARELIDSMNNPSMIKDVSVSAEKYAAQHFLSGLNALSNDTNKILSGLNAGWEGTKKGIDSGFNKLGNWAVEYKANAGKH